VTAKIGIGQMNTAGEAIGPNHGQA